MEKKTTKVATAENNVTTTKIDKTPTGKVKTIKDKEAIKKAREEQYKNFRIGALKRRAKRMRLSEEETKKKIEELLVQLDTPNSYSVLILFSPKDESLVVQALKNEDLTWKMKSNSHLFIDADQETLATLRSIMPPTAKIHPYVKKKPPVLPAQNIQKEEKKPKNRASIRAAAKAAKAARKAASRIKGRNTNYANIEHSRKGLSCFRKRVNKMRMSKIERKEFKERVKELRKSFPKKTTGVFAGKSSKEKKAISASMKDHYMNVAEMKKIRRPHAPNFTKSRVFHKGRIIIPQPASKPTEGKEMASTELKQAA